MNEKRANAKSNSKTNLKERVFKNPPQKTIYSWKDKKVAIPTGVEPVTCHLGGDRSIRLSYGTAYGKYFKGSTAFDCCLISK